MEDTGSIPTVRIPAQAAEWEKKGLFRADVLPGRRKFFLTFPFPYVNGAMHMGHGFTFTRLDVAARYHRLRGENVLFPFGFHATGEPIAGVAARLKAGDPKQRQILLDGGVLAEEIESFKDPVFIVNYWRAIFKDTVTAIGGSIDWRRSFVTTTLTPTFSRFIEWQYNTLRKLGYVVQGTHPVVYCLNDQSPTGDHDRLYGEGASPEEYVLVKFRLEGAGEVLPCGTLRPETMFGATNLWINNEGKYLRIRVDGKEEWIVGEPTARKLENQLRKVEVLGPVDPKALIGKNVTNPVNGRAMPVLPAPFVDPAHASGVVVSVQAHAPYDYIALQDYLKAAPFAGKIKPIVLIETAEFKGTVPAEEICRREGIASQADEAKLEKATSSIYKTEFHTGRLLPITGKYAGMPVSECKDRLAADFVSAGWADRIWECSEKVVCRCNNRCIVKILENQWFLKFSDEEWKARVRECVAGMAFYPDTIRPQFENTINWLKDKACARRSGLGTPLPWDKGWIVETLSDSVIYMAYYTIAHIISRDGVRVEDMTDDLLDYVFRDGGRPPGAKGWADEMRESFLYWYPVDLRGSGKDLVQNHLTYYLFHHVALFGKKGWPAAITVNGYVNVEGEKMSKSKGNFVTLREALETYGADAVRFSLVHASDGFEDPDWRRSDAESILAKIRSFVSGASQIPDGGQDPHLDSWLSASLGRHVADAAEAYSQIRTRSAMQAAFFGAVEDLRWYQRRGGSNGELVREYYRTLATILSPVIPFAAEEIWKELGEKGFASQAAWPEATSPSNSSIFPAEELIERTLSDAKTVSGLVGKPFSRAYVYSAPEWKHTLLSVVRDNAGKPAQEVIAAAMRVPRIKAAGGEAVPLIQKLLKNPAGIRSEGPNAEEEYRVLKSAEGFLSRELGKEVAVERADAPSHDPAKKSRVALPGKPAIFLE